MPDASFRASLNPVFGKTGISEARLTKLSAESTITDQQLIQLDACVKVHLSVAGPDKNIILASGKIGGAFSKSGSGGRRGMRVCKIE